MKKIEIEIVYNKLKLYTGILCKIIFYKDNFKVHYIDKKLFNKGELTSDYIDLIRWTSVEHGTTEVVCGKTFMSLFADKNYYFLFINHNDKNSIVSDIYEIFDKASQLTPYPIKKEYKVETFQDLITLYRILTK